MPKSNPIRKINNIHSMVNMVNTIANNRSSLVKTDTNLPAKLMSMDNYKPMKHMKHMKGYSTSVSSIYSSAMHNGKIHSASKEVIDDSRTPYIQVKETHNGQYEEYVIPKTQIQSSITKGKKTKKIKSKSQITKVMKKQLKLKSLKSLKSIKSIKRTKKNKKQIKK
jgi:hypothetical protein